MYHGLSAFNRAAKIHELIRRAERLASVSACYADVPIGPIGTFTAIGHAKKVHYLADRDIYSQVDERGNRYWENSYQLQLAEENPIIEPEPGQDVEKLYQEILARKAGKYVEISAEAEPDFVWFDKKFGKRWEKAARVVARRLGLPVVSVGRNRI